MNFKKTCLCSSILLVGFLTLWTTTIHGQIIRMTDSVVAPHEIIKCTYDSFPGNPQDWIAVAKKDAGNYLQFHFLNSQKKGSLEFNGLPYGDYELRGYYNNEGTIRTKLNFRIGNKDTVPKISSAQAVVKPNDSIRLTFSGFPGNDLDWISIATPGSNPDSYVEFKYLNKKQSGTLVFSGRSFGIYELRGFFNNENTIRFQSQLIIGDQTLMIVADKPVFNSNETIKLSYSGFPGNAQDWISIAKTGTPPANYVHYKYLNSQKSGNLTFDPVPDGDYELRGYVNNESTIRVIAPIKVGNQVSTSQLPGTLNIQGVLTTAAGQLVPNGTYSITFKFYSSIQGGTAIWEEKLDNINVQSGVFSAILGKQKALNIPFDKPYFLGIQVGQETEMTPRIELTSTPYSLIAKTVENNSISTDKIQPDAVTIDKIASPLISSINGISNDGGNIKILAGANVAIVNDDLTKSITIYSVNPGGGSGGISRINPGTAIAVAGQDGPTTTISVSPNSITNNELQNNAVTTDKIAPNVISSLSGISNDGGNINLVAGNNISIIPDDANKTITISAAGGGTGTGSISQLTEGNGIGIQNPFGPNTTIGLKPNILLGPSGSLSVLNQNSTLVGSLSATGSSLGGFLNISNGQGTSVAGITTLSDGQPLVFVNSRLGRQVVDIKANEFSDGEINLKSVSGNTTIKMTNNENAGGLINVFNSVGRIALQMTTRPIGDGLLTLNSIANVRVLEMRSNTGGGGFLGLFNEFGTESVRLTTSLASGGQINVYNRSGNLAAYSAADNLGDGGLFINSGENLPALDLTVDENTGGGFIGVLNSDANDVIRISSYPDRQPYVKLFNRLGGKVGEFTANEFSDGELTLGSVLGNPTVQLSATDNTGGLIDVFNQLSEPVIRMNTNEVGDGGLFLFSGQNVPVLDLATNLNRGGLFTLRNQDATEVFRLSTLANRQPTFLINNRLGNQVMNLTANEFSDGELTINSVLENPVLLLTANQGAGGLVNVFNPIGNTIAVLTDDGGGYFGIFNIDQTEMIQLRILEDRNARMRVNNRLANPSADLFSNEFSDGELRLYSVLNNPTVRATANENAGGLINIFNQSGKIAARLTESTGGHFTIFNSDEAEMIQIRTLEDGNGLIRVNNRLGTPVADLMSTTFSDGQLTLGSVLGNRTVLLTANDNAGGLINVFNQNRSVSAQLTESDGDGLFKIFNRDSQLVHHLFIDGQNGGLFEIKSKFKFPENVAEMGGNEDDEGHLYLFNRNSKAAVYISAAGGDGDLSLRDIDGKIKTSLSGSRYGGTLSIRNENNEPVHFMGSNGKTKEGFYSIFNKSDINKNRLSMGGDSLGNGYLNVFNFNGLNTFFMGHNQFADGMISIKNSMGNLGALIDALKDGGSVTVTDGKPGTNHRGVLLNGLNGGRLNLFNNQTKLVNVISVGDNGEGLWQIVSKQDLTKNRIEMGGDNTGAGFAKFFNNNAQKNAEIGTTETLSGYISTYSSSGKRQTYISPGGVPGGAEGGAVSVMNNTEKIIGTMGFDGYGGTVFITNSDSKGSALMTHNTRGGRFFTQNIAGKTIGELSTANDLGGELNIFNSTGINTSKLSHSTNGSGQLEIGTPNGNKVVRVTSSDGAGFIGVDNIDNMEVVRITANLGKGGGIALRNDKGFDKIHLTQDQSHGAILVNNANGSLLTSITHNSGNGAFIRTLDQNGKEALWLTTGLNGGGHLSMFNALGKVVGDLNTDVSNNGLFTIHNNAGINLAGLTINGVTGGGTVFANNSSGKEVVRISSEASGNGTMTIDNSAGVKLAGMTNNPVTSGGTVFANNSSGKEVVRITSETAGNGSVTIDNSAGLKLAGINKNSANGGLVFANNSMGKEVIRMATSGTGAGYLTMDNSAGATIAAIVPTLNNGGQINVANSSGGTIASIETTSNNGGQIRIANSSGAAITTLSSNSASEGNLEVNNAAGQKRGFMTGFNNGGQIGLFSNFGKQSVFLDGKLATFTLQDIDNSSFNAEFFGIGFRLTLKDKLSKVRAELKEGYISTNGKNGEPTAFISTRDSDNSGYIGIYNSNNIGALPEAGMFIDGLGKGIVFGDVKNFKMDYPGKPDKQIWYGSLEGPELAAYIRGTGKLINGKASIEFTDHYQKVANTGTMTVILTPLSGKSKGLAVVNKKNTGFEVEELMEGSGTYDFDWEVKCVRNGYEGFEVVRNKADDPQPFRSESNLPKVLESTTTNKIEPEPILHEKKH